MVSEGTSHSTKGWAKPVGHSLAMRPMASAAISVLPPPVGMRKHTQGMSPNGSVL
jgi:hypothetical protein